MKTYPGDKVRQVFGQHVRELDGATLLERQCTLRRVPALRKIGDPARVKDVLSLDAVRTAPQQRLVPRDARLRRVRGELAGKRERGREHVFAVRVRRQVQPLQQRRVGRVRAAAEQQRNRTRIPDEAWEEESRGGCCNRSASAAADPRPDRIIVAYVPSAVTPRRTNGRESLAPAQAKRKSHGSCRPVTPMPTACPFTAATVTFRQRKMARATFPPESLSAEAMRYKWWGKKWFKRGKDVGDWQTHYAGPADCLPH